MLGNQNFLLPDCMCMARDIIVDLKKEKERKKDGICNTLIKVLWPNGRTCQSGCSAVERKIRSRWSPPVSRERWTAENLTTWQTEI
ncbi:hypothetical protein RRG08_027493 [Elysia crispata]|uniref:Uncharacterized protein n=1 Tax=Elysia crispata TaxID=231223 RepID=A0AAE0YSY7_9GAST|nr:hypothetical protein RRG08_027493 [Elysia crispata]